MNTRTTVISGVVLDEVLSLSLSEFCQSCGVSAELVIELVDEGVLEPRGQVPAEWRFEGRALQRAQAALRLIEDLRLNLAGVALALDLLDEIDVLRRRLRRLEGAWPPER